jgi:hypothetical protein
VSIAGASVTEGNSGTTNASFAVTQSAASASVVTVQYATANGSAQAGTDYTATSGTLTFAAGETSQAIAVPILGDTTVEPNETFTVTLSNPTGATLGTAQATGTIANDDAAVSGCSPRPRVAASTTAGDGALRVQIETTPLNAGAGPNPLQRLVLGTFQNAAVTVNGEAVISGQTVTLPPNTSTATIVVRRASTGQPTTVPLTVIDGCGEWETFVGGGASAGF